MSRFCFRQRNKQTDRQAEDSLTGEIQKDNTSLYDVSISQVGHAVGTALRAGRSRFRFPVVSLEFFIDIIQDSTMALGFTQPLTEMITSNISWRVKAADG